VDDNPEGNVFRVITVPISLALWGVLFSDGTDGAVVLLSLNLTALRPAPQFLKHRKSMCCRGPEHHPTAFSTAAVTVASASLWVASTGAERVTAVATRAARLNLVNMAVSLFLEHRDVHIAAARDLGLARPRAAVCEAVHNLEDFGKATFARLAALRGEA
jgi:hypothetical protein